MINYPTTRKGREPKRLVNCEVCKKEIYITPTRLRKNKHHTCSKECWGKLSSALHSQKIKINCVICGKDIFYKQSHFKKVKFHTCSRECAAQVKKDIYKGSNNPKAKLTNMSDIEKFFYKRVMAIAARSSAEKYDFNLDMEFLIDIYNKQNGLCYYSGFPLNFNKEGIVAKFDTLSVDKIIPEKGYTKGNVVLCLNCVNKFKCNYSLDDLKKVFKSIFIKESPKISLKIKKLYPDSISPKRNSPSDAGIDLYVHRVEDCGHYIKVYSGVSIQPEVGYFTFLAPRSSSYKKGLSLFNNLGIIDNSYTGEIIGLFLKEENYEEPKPGDRVLQLIAQKQVFFEPVWVDELDETDRNKNGFGSSGN